ncbi:MAG: hypothetical protein M1819_001679 [Sarea resinae]|nr:MAG: hypothetical protein M1819_001679 [Sarea resinae]
MFSRFTLAAALLAGVVNGLPNPQTSEATPTLDATAVIPSEYTTEVPPPSLVASNPGATSHGPYTGTPTTTGAQSLDVQASSIPALPPSPAETNGYNSSGVLQDPEPAPYTPAGGLGTNGSEPVYAMGSDFDYQSLALGLYQEWIELDLFHNGLAKFSVADFEAAGLTAEDRSLIEFMADQESGHATLISNMLGASAPKQCQYNYPYTTVREYIDFNQKLTRFGESGVYGFLNHLDSRAVGQLLLQSITTEARQQMIFRQFNGQFPMPVWFEVGIPQSWAWTLLAPYIASCPQNQTRLAWQNFPTLHVLNQPNPARIDANDTGLYETVGNTTIAPLNETGLSPAAQCVNSTIIGEGCGPAITHNRSVPLSYPGRVVQLAWDAPGQAVGPNNSYVTSTSAGTPAYVAWVTQLNVTYSALKLTSNSSGTTIQPNVSTYAGDPAINGTMFIALTDSPLPLTPFNLSMINPHVVALSIYQAG